MKAHHRGKLPAADFCFDSRGLIEDVVQIRSLWCAPLVPDAKGNFSADFSRAHRREITIPFEVSFFVVLPRRKQVTQPGDMALDSALRPLMPTDVDGPQRGVEDQPGMTCPAARPAFLSRVRPWVALLSFLGRPDAGIFRLGHGDGLAAPPG